MPKTPQLDSSSRFDTILVCDGQTDRRTHMATAYRSPALLCRCPRDVTSPRQWRRPGGRRRRRRGEGELGVGAQDRGSRWRQVQTHRAESLNLAWTSDKNEAKPFRPRPRPRFVLPNGVAREKDSERKNARCTQARKTTHGLDGQHQVVDRTLTSPALLCRCPRDVTSPRQWRRPGGRRWAAATRRRRAWRRCARSRAVAAPGSSTPS